MHASFPSDAYTDEDLMLYWKSGDESLSTDDRISLSQFLIQKFHTTSRLAFYSSTGRLAEQTLSFTEIFSIRLDNPPASLCCNKYGVFWLIDQTEMELTLMWLEPLDLILRPNNVEGHCVKIYFSMYNKIIWLTIK